MDYKIKTIDEKQYVIRFNDNGTQNILTDYTIEIGERILELPIGGVKINHFKNYNSPENTLSSGKIYLKGGLGTRSIINLFDKDGDSQVIEDLRLKNNILINQANLIFHVDPLFVQTPFLFLIRNFF